MRPKAEILTSAYQAFNRRDIEEVLLLMHADVDWPNMIDGGRIHGRDGVCEYWKRQWSVIDPHVEPLAFEDDDSGHTVVRVHQVVRDLSGQILADRMVQHVYLVRNGLIERMDVGGQQTGIVPELAK